MDLETTLVYLLARAIPHISPDIQKTLEIATRECHSKAKVTENPWDDVAITLLASMLSVDL